jgi:hypothetical protein
VILSRLWQRLKPKKLTPEEFAELQKEQREYEKRRKQGLERDLYEGFPSEDAVKGFLWFH